MVTCTMDGATLEKQGAEARVYRIPYPGRGTAIVKERFRKAYRQPDLDRKLTSRRVIQEARSLQRCKRAGLDTPTLYLLDVEGAMIYMEDIAGKSVRDTLGFSGDYGSHGVLSEQIGKNIALMHNLDVIHGDLTTSNMMVRSTSNNLVIIDFGLSFVSTLQEDKAVDLYVLERALSSTHPGSEKLFKQVLAEYAVHIADNGILSRLSEVRKRGRKRTAFG